MFNVGDRVAITREIIYPRIHIRPGTTGVIIQDMLTAYPYTPYVWKVWMEDNTTFDFADDELKLIITILETGLGYLYDLERSICLE